MGLILEPVARQVPNPCLLAVTCEVGTGMMSFPRKGNWCEVICPASQQQSWGSAQGCAVAVVQALPGQCTWPSTCTCGHEKTETSQGEAKEVAWAAKGRREAGSKTLSVFLPRLPAMVCLRSVPWRDRQAELNSTLATGPSSAE